MRKMLQWVVVFCTLFGSVGAMAEDEGRMRAILAGGCFWGMEDLLKELPGVTDTQVGYVGGDVVNPDYKAVSSGLSGHAEAVEVWFDPEKVSYEDILKFFFRIHDPTTLNQQGNDVGPQYRSAIFTLDDVQKNVAYNMLAQAERSGVFEKPVVTQIVPAGEFYPAEEYHQDYLDKNPGGYSCHYIRKDVVF